MRGRELLKRLLFIVFVVAVNGFVLTNALWFLFPLVISLIPSLAIVSLASMLGFITLEEWK